MQLLSGLQQDQGRARANTALFLKVDIGISRQYFI